MSGGCIDEFHYYCALVVVGGEQSKTSSPLATCGLMLTNLPELACCFFFCYSLDVKEDNDARDVVDDAFLALPTLEGRPHE